MSNSSLNGLVSWYETLTLASVERVSDFYAHDAHFVDPFNDVRGTPAIALIFRHMFQQVDAPRFIVEQRFENGAEAMLTWRFEFASRGKAWSIPGASALRFNEAGKVASHRDYWDPARELYAGLPVVGGLFRWLTRQFAARSANP